MGLTSRRLDAPRFDRSFFRSAEPITRIGGGALGGKAAGLLRIREMLASEHEPVAAAGCTVGVPKMVVVATDAFDAFVSRNALEPLAEGERSDERIALAFQRAELPAEIAGDLRAIVDEVRTPLAVRSSSLLEDALARPFAGVYATKMTPNADPDPDARFRKLVEAVKLVWASTWFRQARDYRRASGGGSTSEKMAVIIQEVVGQRHDTRFYPHVSGVARSYNFFPFGGADPRDGVIELALGLGKTIVDGGASWMLSPARPLAPPPFASMQDRLEATQLEFWAVSMEPAAYDPVAEAEYLVRADLAAAEYDGTLTHVASTYDPERDRIVPGTAATGPRVVDFAPLLARGEVHRRIRALLEAGAQALGTAAEIEFALTLPAGLDEPLRCGMLQLRPMLVSEQAVELSDAEWNAPDLLLASDRVMGNGVIHGIHDVVYVVPERFKPGKTREIAGEVAQLDRALAAAGRPYLLAGFGRWGSADPWLGIPVQWSQISGARAIVESTLSGMDVEPSQGAHFFHNLVAFGVAYFCVRHGAQPAGRGRAVDWAWLQACPAAAGTDHVRHVRLERPLRIKLDGRRGRGAVWRP